MQRRVTLGLAGLALAALGGLVAGPGWSAATGPAGLGLPVFLAVAVTMAAVDHRSRRRVPVAVTPRAPVAIPSQRAAAAAERLSTSSVTGVVARR